MMSRTSIGGLLLDAGEDGWSFSVVDGSITATFDDQPGVLRVAVVAPNRIPQPCTHERCLQLVADWLGVAAPRRAKFHDLQLKESVTGPYGSASFRGGPRGRGDYVSVWYCTRAPGLIMGAYACPASF